MMDDPPGCRYVRPTTLKAALAYVAEEQAAIVAGGQTFLPRLAAGAVSPRVLVDLGAVEELRRIEFKDGTATIGAMVRLAEAARSTVLRTRLPLLAECAEKTASIAIRNLGTLIGNLACADPASQLPVVALALDTVFRLERLGAVRDVRAEDFFVGANATAVEADEIITLIAIEAAESDSGAGLSFVPLRRNSRALATAAVTVGLDAVGNVNRVAIAVGGCDDRPRRCRDIEARLIGLPAADAPEAAAKALIAEPPARGAGVIDADYALSVLPVLVRRSIAKACSVSADPGQAGCTCDSS